MCAENVLRLAAIDCSSPMSANTDWNTGRRADLGRDEQAGLRHQREQSRGLDGDGLAAGVRAGDEQDAASAVRAGCRSEPASTLRQRMPRRLSSSSAVVRRPSSGRDAVHAQRRTAPSPAARRARWRRRATSRARPAARGSASVSSSRMRKISSRSRSSSSTMSLLISTVADGSRKSVAPLAELPCTMPGTLPRCSARTIST